MGPASEEVIGKTESKFPSSYYHPIDVCINPNGNSWSQTIRVVTEAKQESFS